MTDLVQINGVQINVVSNNETFLVSNREVALAFGAGETSIRNMKNRNKEELLENVHWVTQFVSGVEITMWTKKGIITLGFKLQTTPKTIAFRDWASDFIIHTQRPLSIPEQIQLIAQGNQIIDQRLTILEKTKRLENWQERALHDAKNNTVYRIANGDDALAKRLHLKVWSLFKKKFHLPRYNELPAIKFEEGKSYILNLSLADMV